MRRGLPRWLFGLAGAIALVQPLSWALLGIVDRSDSRSWMLLGFTAISAFAYWQAVRWLRFSVVPVMFVFLFLVAYPARVSLVEQNLDLFTITGGHTSVGRFAFDSSSYATYYLLSILGLGGLLVGSRLGTGIFRRVAKRGKWHGDHAFLGLGWLCIGWFFLSFGVSLICFYQNIGLAGVVQPRLPFHLTGLLNFIRLFVLPALSWFLFGLAYERRATRWAILLLLLVAVHGIASIYFTLSKAGLMYAILPLVAYLAMRAPVRALTWKIVFGSAVALFALLPLTYFGAMVLREEVYYGQTTSRGDALRQIVADHAGDEGGLGNLVQGTLVAVMSRVTGGDELMAVTASPPYQSNVVLGLLAGKGADPDFGGTEMFLEIFNVQLINQDGLFSGKAFGLFAALYLGHSYLLVFAGSAFFGALAVGLEYCVLRYGNQGLATGVAFWIVLAVWEAGFDTLWHYPPILLVMLFLLQSIKLRRQERSVGQRFGAAPGLISTGTQSRTC